MTSLGFALRAVVSHRGVQIVATLWVVGCGVVLWLAQGSLPFDRPAVMALPFSLQLAMPTVGMIEVFVLMVGTFHSILSIYTLIMTLPKWQPDLRYLSARAMSCISNASSITGLIPRCSIIPIMRSNISTDPTTTP